MTRFYKQKADAEFLLSTASGSRSFEEIVVATSAEPYESGTVLVENVDGVFARATALTLAEEGAYVALLVNRTVTEAGETADALAVVRDAEVKAHSLELSTTLPLSDVQPYLEKQGIIVRS